MSCVFILCELKILTCFVITKPIIFPCLDSLILVENILKVEIIKKKKKKSERWRIDAFELCYWRRLLRVPWTARRANQSILKEINPEYSLEGLMLILKLQYFGYMMQRADSLEKTLMLRKIESSRRRWQKMRWLDGIIELMDMSSCKLQEMVKDGEAWHAAVHRVTKSRTWLRDWTTTTTNLCLAQ